MWYSNWCDVYIDAMFKFCFGKTCQSRAEFSNRGQGINELMFNKQYLVVIFQPKLRVGFVSASNSDSLEYPKVKSGYRRYTQKGKT